MLERILTRLRALWEKILEWWGKFNSRQKTLIISVAAAVVVALVVVISILTQPKYEILSVSESTKQTSEIQALLDENNISYKTSTDGLTVSVLKEDYSDAIILLGANDIPAVGANIDSVFSGGFRLPNPTRKRNTRYISSSISQRVLKDRTISNPQPSP